MAIPVTGIVARRFPKITTIIFGQIERRPDGGELAVRSLQPADRIRKVRRARPIKRSDERYLYRIFDFKRFFLHR